MTTVDNESPTPAGGPDRPDRLPLSFAQERLWFLEQLVPDSAIQNVPLAARLHGELDIPALCAAFDTVVRRHEALRTVFETVNGEPAQRVLDEPAVPLTEIDLTGLPPEAREERSQAELGRLAAEPFDLRTGPLLRIALIAHTELDHLLVLVMHHIVSDGWSIGVLLREVSQLYAAEQRGMADALPELPVQYADYALWQRERMAKGEYDEDLKYWMERLDNSVPVLEIPTACQPEPGESDTAAEEFSGGRVSLDLGPELTAAIENMSRQERCTPYMTLLAAYALLLHRHSGQSSLVIGTPIANRNQLHIEELIGFFVNTLALRFDLDADGSFRDLLAQARRVALGAFGHQDLPFEKLVEELRPERKFSQAPLFQVMFVMQNTPNHPLELPGVEVDPVDVHNGTAKFDLLLSVTLRDGSLRAVFEYDAAKFDATTVTMLLDRYRVVLEEAVAQPARSLTALPMLPDSERAELLRIGRRQAAQPVDACLHELFGEQARRTPEARAVTFGSEHLTYAELDSRATSLAERLRDTGVRSGERVALFLDRSLDTVVAILGVLKVGATYVPMDNAYPTARLQAIVTDARPVALLTQRRMLSQLPSYDGSLIVLDDDEVPTGRTVAVAVPAPAPADDPDSGAYVIYTSGSTGTPKGVEISHRNVVRLFRATERLYGFDERDVWTMFHSYAFDVSVWELWGALLYGGRVVVVPSEVAKVPEDYHELVGTEGVTVLNQTPSAFAYFAAADARQSEQRATTLRYVIFAGEALEPASLRQWIARHGDATPRLVNMYGITETTVHVTYRVITADDLDRTGSSPIGAPLPDLELYVLDDALRPMPFGVPGELYVGGAGLATGYLGAPQLTAQRFVPHPFSADPGARLYRSGDLARVLASGDIEYLGRADQQVKIRGFRIETGEIEAGLLAEPGVSAAVVTAHEGTDGDRRLVAYVVADPELLPEATGRPADASSGGVGESLEQVGEWQMVFDGMYGSQQSDLADDFNVTGWNSSYTNKPIAAEHMREWVDTTVDAVRALRPRRVLEIGCGTGLLLQRLAPDSEHYYGTDLSAAALESLNRRLPQGEITLCHQAAHDTRGLPAGHFDTVVLNSVAQYFPGPEYLTDVLVAAAELAARPATLFVGDIRDLALTEAFHLSVELFKADDAMPLTRLRQQLALRMREEGELVCDPRYFYALRGRIPDLGSIEIRPRRGRHRNEMSSFRYDALLHLGADRRPVPERELEWDADELTGEKIAGLLAVAPEDGLHLRGVPNPRVTRELRAMELLRAAPPGSRVGDLRRSLARWEPQRDGVEIEDLHELAERHGLELRTEWSSRLPGHYDAIVTRHSAPTGARPTAVRFSHEVRPGDAPELYASQPALARRRRDLVPRLRELLKERVPHYMVPSAFIVLDGLPLTPNGKVDREALPVPGAERPVVRGGFVAPRTPTERAVAERCAALLGLERVGAEDNFFELGGHSLLATQFVFRLREDLGTDLPLRALFESPTMAGIAAAIDGSAQAGADAADLPAQVRLADDVRPAAEVVHCAGQPRHVLLTGATGFFGAFLLRELLRRTTAVVHCLVRGRDEQDAAKRLRANLERYGLADADDRDQRLAVVAGDLAEPSLGLSPRKFDELARTVDAVYHSGAAVNLVYPYAELKAPNVQGTEEVLRLAARHRSVPVHHISTVGVFAPSGERSTLVAEGDPTGPPHALDSGYTRSKWVAEGVVRLAQARGLPVSVYRPARIVGDSLTGACQTDDFLWRVLKGCVQAKAVPAGVDFRTDLVPVDHVSAAVVELSCSQSAAGGTYHLSNPTGVALSEILGHLRSFGYELVEVPLAEWKRIIGSDPGNAVFPLLGTFTDSAGGGLGDLVFDSMNTERELSGAGMARPRVDRELFATYVDYFVRTGFLPESVEHRDTEHQLDSDSGKGV
ncbi:non-ribosomal peptide synthetase [Streptomyces sp. SID8375]|uniref:non-ribosomal peptide synthetase n=1 Tax=unclassified Streptomyces TaxID=2593676 RepID=UPI0003AA18E0|nr:MULTISPECIES: non-ribosomal peptide synthetase [unclassified Streptomyces]MYX09095.1 non-ribosomal peptide synthetase [Streptomyces sp. SID8375]